MENSFLCLIYIADTLDVWRWNKLALATYYDTLYVSRLFDMRDSGGFPTFHSVLSFSVSMIFGRLCLYKRPYCSLFFPINKSIHYSDSFIHSYHLLFRSLFRSKSICLYHSQGCSLHGSEYHGSHQFAIKLHSNKYNGHFSSALLSPCAKFTKVLPLTWSSRSQDISF